MPLGKEAGARRIVGVELNHHRAPLNVRERVSLSAEAQAAALGLLRDQMGEAFLLATCNRTAIYAYTDDIQPILDFFTAFGQLDPYLSYYTTEEAAINHLFATAAGLESQALGEHEILGQIRDAYALAQSAGAAGPVMHELIKRAIHAGKNVRKSTAIGRHAVSLAAAAYQCLRRHLPNPTAKVVLLGTGQMGQLMYNVLEKKHQYDIIIASHSLQRARQMAAPSGAQYADFASLGPLLTMADAVIGATSAASVITPQMLQGKRPLVCIDLGMPRNIDPGVKDVENCRLLDLDDIKAVTDENFERRRNEIPQVLKIVEDELSQFTEWLHSRKLSPIITSYFAKLKQVQEEEVRWAFNRIGNLDEATKKIVEELASRLARRVSGKPIEALRRFGIEPDKPQSRVDTFKELFDL